MYSKIDILSFIKQGESSTLSFFSGDINFTSLMETIVAMANTYGGIILLGVKPDGSVEGVGDVKNLCGRISEKFEELCQPVFKFDLHPVRLNGNTVLLLGIPVAGPDIFYTSSGNYLVRDGQKNTAVSKNEIYILSMRREPLRFELIIDKRARLSDINFEMVERFRRKLEDRTGLKINVPALNILETRGFVVNDRFKMNLNYGAILSFAKTPQKFFPYSFITAVDFRTSNKFLRKDFYGNLFDLVDNAYDFIMERLSDIDNSAPSFYLDISDINLRQSFAFVIKELLINAVTHSDYSIYGDRIYILIFEDRLEIINPGGIYIDSPNFYNKKLKNPRIHNLLTEYYFDEGFSFGMDEVNRVCEILSLKKPEFSSPGSNFRALLWLIREDDGKEESFERPAGAEINASCEIPVEPAGTEVQENEYTEIILEASEVIDNSGTEKKAEITEPVVEETLLEVPETEKESVFSLTEKSGPEDRIEIEPLVDEPSVKPAVLEAVREGEKKMKKDEEKVSLKSGLSDSSKSSSGYKEREESVLDYLKKHGEITRTQCEELLRIEPRTANRILKAMTEKKLVYKKGSGTNFYYVLSI